MKKYTKEIRKTLQSLSYDESKVNLLRHHYKDETAYIVTCGPSLNDYDEQHLREFLSNKLVIAVKQAYHKVSNISDFHVLNLINLCEYDYESNQPITVIHTINGRKDIDEEYDIVLPTNRCCKDFFNDNIATTYEFNKNRLKNNIERIPACGIVATVAFFLCEHISVNKIITIGYDNSSSEHFYKDRGKDKEINIKLDKASIGASQKESYLLQKSIPHWRQWFKENGIEIYKAKCKSTSLSKIPLPAINLGVKYSD